MNVTMTNPKVTYDDQIVMTLEVVNSALGADVNVAGSNIPSFTNRQVDTVVRLRDGESRLIAGLLREQDRKQVSGFPGIAQIPILRAIFGSSDDQIDTTDIVMMITPHIIRTHEMTVDDLRPIYVGTQRNFGLTGPPPLIAAPDSPPASASVPSNFNGTAMPPAPQPMPSTPNSPQPTAPAAVSSNAPGIVPVTPVNTAAARLPQRRPLDRRRSCSRRPEQCSRCRMACGPCRFRSPASVNSGVSRSR